MRVRAAHTAHPKFATVLRRTCPSMSIPRCPRRVLCTSSAVRRLQFFRLIFRDGVVLLITAMLGPVSAVISNGPSYLTSNVRRRVYVVDSKPVVNLRCSFVHKALRLIREDDVWNAESWDPTDRKKFQVVLGRCAWHCCRVHVPCSVVDAIRGYNVRLHPGDPCDRER